MYVHKHVQMGQRWELWRQRPRGELHKLRPWDGLCWLRTKHPHDAWERANLRSVIPQARMHVHAALLHTTIRVLHAWHLSCICLSIRLCVCASVRHLASLILQRRSQLIRHRPNYAYHILLESFYLKKRFCKKNLGVPHKMLILEPQRREFFTRLSSQ